MRDAVIDSNVFVYGALDLTAEGPIAEAVLRKAATVWAPASVFAECLNALRRHVKRGDLSADEAETRLDQIPPLIAHAVPVPDLWRRALQLSELADHSPFDTLFVALAEREELPVVTFDRKLANKFPQLCLAPAAFLAAP